VKKVMFLTLSVAIFAGMAMAQTYTQGTGITGIDKLGAHQNGGRGCTGCHAPHSGGRGGGGNAATGAVANTDGISGNTALWGQDTTPLLGLMIHTGDTTASYYEPLPSNEAANASGEVTGILFCLSCHDGNVAKGGMMTNALYEQKIGKLPANVYGPSTIPTLLGNDGSTAGNYNNDHPVGVNAILGTGMQKGAIKMTAGVVSYASGVSTQYDAFVANYGNFFQGRATLGVGSDGTMATAFVMCTTCHTPHTMYTASGTWAGVSGTYPTYFFLVAPYNPGSLAAVNNGTKASSATQFCRSCHFTGAGGSNEGSNINGIATAF
jgi:hypothetical protein